jgi:pyruvate,water dikinase
VRRADVVTTRLGDPLAGRVGGKAEGLARLFALGLPVPPAVVVPVGGRVGDALSIARELGEPLAVRSSAVGEDARDRSAAGQYETLLGVRAADLAEAIEHIRTGTSRARAYGAGEEVAVIVQRQVPATKSGVAFSRDPLTGEEVYVVECAFGSGDAVVSGEVLPDRFRVSGESVGARVAGPVRTLRDDEVQEIVSLVARAEEGFGHPVDVEFCYERRQLWLVQCRAITTA